MSRSSIEWLHRPGTLPESWNFVTGCNKVDRGCKHCYAEIMHRRLQYMYPQKYDHDFLTGAHVHADLLTLPFTWKKPRTVFVNSMSDLFHHQVADKHIDKAFAVMALTPQHTYIIATKRPEIAVAWADGGNYEERVEKACEELAYTEPNLFFETERLKGWGTTTSNRLQPHLVKAGFYSDTSYTDDGNGGVNKEPEFIYEGKWPLPNVWLLVSVNDQASANLRIPLLLQIPAAVRGISAEPLTGPIDLEAVPFEASGKYWTKDGMHPFTKAQYLDWIICGGESGRKASPMHPWWPKSLRNQARAAGVPFFFKQWGLWARVDFDKPFAAKHFGHFYDTKNFVAGELLNPEHYSPNIVNMAAVGKKAAGRTLDYCEHNGFPGDIEIDDLPF